MFAGHLIVDKLKSQREMKEAVSTSHSSQPNTVEYDMAMEWFLMTERSNQFWKKLYEVLCFCMIAVTLLHFPTFRHFAVVLSRCWKCGNLILVVFSDALQLGGATDGVCKNGGLSCVRYSGKFWEV
ncbi:Protein winged eye [Gossypium australe]|uniref:Protein winged eye n=1 Tax=Gossypium australe TaxID=47621 RepID=A0A5B6X6W6_9ROSI|nr:Protein winged eye [Gossypium australe]